MQHQIKAKYSSKGIILQQKASYYKGRSISLYPNYEGIKLES